MTDRKLTQLDASATVDFIYGELSGVSKKITSANVVTQGSPVFAASSLLGRGTSGAGVAETIALGTGLSMIGATLNASVSSGTNGLVYLSSFLTGSGDQTVNIQAALDSFSALNWTGTLIWDVVGKIDTTDTIHVGSQPHANNSGPTAFINIHGIAGADNCGISYNGPTDRAALAFHKNKFFTLKNLDVTNDSGAGFGSSIGISFGGQGGGSGSGTQTLAGYLENVRVIKWNVGIQMGADFGEASEFVMTECTFYENNTAFLPTGFNCLDYTFIMCNMSDNFIGINSGASDGFQVLGGSATNNKTCDFYVDGNGEVSLYAYRVETNLGAPMVMGNFGRSIMMQNCQLFSSAAVPGVVVAPTFSRISIDTCIFNGRIEAQNGNTIIIKDTVTIANPNTRLPFFFANTGDWGAMPFVQCENNLDYLQVTSLDNYQGTVRTTWVDGAPFGGVGVQAPIYRVWDLEPTANTVPNLGADWLALSRVRQLAEGPTPGWNVQTPFLLNTNAATAAGDVVLSFVSVPATIVPYMHVEDVTDASRMHFSATVVSATTTTVTLSAGSVTGAGVQNGDQIKFWEMTGLLTPGKNLRVAGTFGGSATLNFTFKRNLTTEGANVGGQNIIIVATTGVFFPTDVGKPLKLTARGNQSWTDWYGHITKYVDSTHVWVQPMRGQVPPIGTAGTAAVVGEDEPDAAFMVAGIVGNAATPESYSVTAVSTTGITFQSSNAGSTATITALIVR